MLLFLMIAVAVMTIMMLGVARNYRRGIIRDREVEMMHRGDQYSRAVKRYYKKNGTYPNSIEQLEKTNNIRYLRKRYKDPMSPDGAWKLVHLTDITLKAGGGLTPSAATQTGLGTGSGSAFGQSSFGNSSSNAGGSNQGTSGTAGAPSTGTAGTATSGTGTTGAAASGTGTSGTDTPFPGATTAGAPPPGTTDTGGTTAGETTTAGTTSGTSSTFGSTVTASGTALGNNAAAGGQVLGGGPVLGVVSKMKTQGIHSFGDKAKYNEWFFIYDPAQDKGQLLVGPYNPKMFLGASAGAGLTNNIAAPATGTGTTPGSGFSLSNQTSAPTSTTPPSTPTQ